MIEKMKVVHIVSSVSKKQEMLSALRDFGVVHLAEKKSADRAYTERFATLSKTATTLKEFAGKDTKQAAVLSDSEFEAMYTDVLDTIDKKTSTIQERGTFASEAERILPWGDFSPAELKELQAAGFDFHFYRLGKNELDEASKDENVKFIRLASVDNMDTIAVLGRLPETIPATELNLPDKGLNELRAEIARCDAEVDACDAKLKEASAYDASFYDQMLKAQNAEMFSSASNTAESDDDFVWLTGYIPADDLDKFKAFASANGLAWAVEDPAEDDEQIPTKVRYSKVTAKIQPLFDILGILPGYNEQDVSLWFLIFFTIFTAMIIGDAAYGCIFLIVAIAATVKFKKVNDAIFLIYILSIATIIWGAITGTWFGAEAAMKTPLKNLVIPSIANYPEYFGVTSSDQQI
jgi:V/A-type H+-transporting ATPase subunit I